MSATDLASSLVKRFEGCRLNSYRDVKGTLTIGYGHTHNVQEGQEISLEQAYSLLDEDLLIAEQGVIKLIPVQLTSYQLGALIDFVFNEGYSRLRCSTLRHLILNNQFELASNEFNKWVYAGGRKYTGLVLRRNAERQMFNGDI